MQMKFPTTLTSKLYFGRNVHDMLQKHVSLHKKSASLPSRHVTCLGVSSGLLRPLFVSLTTVVFQLNLWLADVSIPTSSPPRWAPDLCQLTH